MTDAVIIQEGDVSTVTINIADVDVQLPTVNTGDFTVSVIGDYPTPSQVKRFTHVQSMASDTWVIPHNLSQYPQVMIMDGTGQQIFASVQHLSLNVVSISFGAPTIGTAELI